jgi:parallel beta-helix repeat protein
VLIITGCEGNISPIESTDKNSDVTVPNSDDQVITPETKTCPVPIINGRTTVCREGCVYNNLADALKNSDNIIITDCGMYNENIKLEKDNVFIDCNNAILDGTGLQTAFDMSSVKAVNIKNCIFNNYNFAISSLDADNIVIENNKFENNVIAVRIKLGTDNIVRSNSFNNNEQAVLIISSNNVLVNKNKISSSKKNGLELTGASKKCIIDDNEFY